MHAALAASFAALAAAAPVVQRQAAPPPAGIDDAVILQYALSLEHLENTFYREALTKFTAADFKAAGVPSAEAFYNNLQQIAKDEETHVNFLETGLRDAGATPVAECSYNFGYTDAQSFLATANILEGVGVSAYLGAAKYIKSADYLTAAGAILTVESRHSSYLRNVQSPPQSPFPAPFDIPLEFNEVYSLAALFITGCPDTPGTTGLGLKAFPAITAAPAGISKVGDVLTFTVAQEVEATNAYFITFPGGAIPAEITGSGANYQVTVPAAAQAGQAYVVLTKNGDKPTDDNIVAGPAVLQIADNAAEFQAQNPGYDYNPKDCKDDKPGQYPTKGDYPSHPEAPKDYPAHPEQPKSPEAPKDYPKHPEQPKYEHQPEAPKYDAHKPEHKPEHEDKPSTYPVKNGEKPEEDCPEEDKPKTHY
ncbi:hypothetical protein CB0940_05068 [Cercospora beticola]|uniref:Protein rds1 n=1 Tax=Cercospora beticola TaxID=122368 RepID=A0A2G5HJH1_CERBT|nr:hypothetical protein CB0940_05068 [Cercospora beticola]PIA92701.1 hypothetical protein CB0940_05068 [Cercospora beticola]WPB02367.1 hypothetical protein RHO25_007001 [Cercospora beticola]